MYEDTSYAENTPESASSASSSPFIDATNHAADPNRENIAPINTQRLSISKSPVDRDHMSPLKMLQTRKSTSPSQSPRNSVDFASSPRKNSAPKRFPVKPSIATPAKTTPQSPLVVEKTVNLDEALRDNEGLTKAIQILEDTDIDHTHNDSRDEGYTVDETFATVHPGDGSSIPEKEARNMDDTMISTFSEFSALPEMASFAKMGHTPAKFSNMGAPTPRQNHRMSTPVTARRPPNSTDSPSPTPRAHRHVKSRDDGNTTNLLDFTEQMHGFNGRGPSPAKHRMSPSKSSTMPDMSWYAQNSSATPTSNRMSNLLDFDIPPAPTPRSMPSITPRELESLKSGFLSEISGLRASLSGKEAELQFLKTAVVDAEKRVGESLEQLREERSSQEQLAAEKEEWEKRGREMEGLLRNVREEMLKAEQDRENLEGRLEESEGRRAAAEYMTQDAQSKLAQLRAGRVTSPTNDSIKSPTECTCGGRTVELAVEKVSRELHSLYKEKHETKVSALKKSYERRWDKRVKELESTVDDLTTENEELKLGRDASVVKHEPSQEDIEKQAAQEARSKELEAELEGLGQEIKSVKADNENLRHLLDEERVEKGNLVQAVEDMIPLVAEYDDMLAKAMDKDKERERERENMPVVQESPATNTKRQSGLDSLKSPTRTNSVSRIGGLRAPSVGSRIGKGIPSLSQNHQRKGSGGSQGSQVSRPGSGMGTARSGIMNSIEKMGSTGYLGRG